MEKAQRYRGGGIFAHHQGHGASQAHLDGQVLEQCLELRVCFPVLLPKDTPPEPDIGDPLPGQKARPAGGPSQCREVQPGGRRRSCRLRGGLITGRCGEGGNNRCGDHLGGQGEVDRGVLAGQGERQQQPKGQQSPEQAAPAGPDGFA